MAQRRHHYDSAFEQYLRASRLPHIVVDEAKRALLPAGARLKLEAASSTGDAKSPSAVGLKSFDFVVYAPGRSLLIDVKGRKLTASGRGEPRRSSLQTWVTREDVASLAIWLELFGRGFEAHFVFVFWCEHQPPDGLFQEIFEHRGRWYALRSVSLAEYAAHMVQRSARWKTVHLPTDAFERVSEPFSVHRAPNLAATR